MATAHLHLDDVPDTLALLIALLRDRTHADETGADVDWDLLVGRSGLQSNPSPSNGQQVPDLNDRQRAYLLAIFETDQELAAEMRDLPYRPFQPRPKADDDEPRG